MTSEVSINEMLTGGDGGSSTQEIRIAISEGADRIVDAFRTLHVDTTWWEDETQRTTGELSNDARRKVVVATRRYVLIHPIARQVSKLWTNYGIGAGILWKARGEKESQSQKIASGFWNNRKNKCCFSIRGQRKLVQIGPMEGEIFFALFGKGADTKVRTVDVLEMSAIATEPDDRDTPLWYIRTRRNDKFQEEFILYRAAFEPPAQEGEISVTRGGVKVLFTNGRAEIIEHGKPITAEIKISDAVVYHWIFDGTGERGEPLFVASLDWLKAQQMFMRDRLAVVRAIAVFAEKLKIKGGQQAVNSLISSLSSTMTQTNANEDNPKHTAGSTWVENAAVDRQPMKQETGAASARIDGEMVMNNAVVGTGQFTQFVGAGNLQNYAMANTMEGPIFKQYTAFQASIEDMFATLFFYALSTGGLSEDESIVDVDTPELIRRDTPALIDAVTKLIAVDPQLGLSDEIRRQILDLFGIDNLDIVLDEIKKGRENMPPPENSTPQQEPSDGGN